MNEFVADAVNLGGCGLVQEQSRLVTPVVEDTVEHEAQGIGGDQRHLARGAKQTAQVEHHAGIGLLPLDDLHGRVAEGGSEEVGDGRASGVFQMGEEALRRQGAGVGCDQGGGLYHGLDLAEDLTLEF